MTLQEAQKFIGHKVRVNWGPLDRPIRKNETIPMDSIGIVEEVYKTCHEEIFAKLVDGFTCPIDVRRLSLHE